MYKHIITAGGLALTATLTGSLAGVGVAHADKADLTERFHDQFTAPDGFLTEVCGFEIWFEVDATGQARFWEDGRIQAQDHGTFTLVNPANGAMLTRFWAGQFKGQGIETLDPDGTLTIEFDDHVYGVHEKWIDPDGGVLIMDRGRASFSGEIVVQLNDPDDPDDDVLVHVHEEFDVRGPHPILEGGGLDPSLACDLLA